MEVMFNGRKYQVLRKQGRDYIAKNPDGSGQPLALDGGRCTVVNAPAKPKPGPARAAVAEAPKPKAKAKAKAKAKKKAAKKTNKAGKKKK